MVCILIYIYIYLCIYVFISCAPMGNLENSTASTTASERHVSLLCPAYAGVVQVNVRLPLCFWCRRLLDKSPTLLHPQIN